MSDCVFTSNGQSSAALPPLFQQDDLVAMFNFSGMPNNALATGAVVLPSEQGPTLAFDSLNQGTTFDILNGTGIRFRANAVSTVFTNVVATRTAAKLSYSWADFWTAFQVDGMRNYWVIMWMSLLTLPTAQTSPAGPMLSVIGIVNVPAGSAARLRGIRRHNAAGVQALNTVSDGAGNANYVVPLPDADTKVLGLGCGQGVIDAYAGQWDTGGGQDFDDVLLTQQVASLVVQTAGGVTYKDQSNTVNMSFASGNVNSDMAVDVQRLAIYSPR